MIPCSWKDPQLKSQAYKKPLQSKDWISLRHHLKDLYCNDSNKKVIRRTDHTDKIKKASKEAQTWQLAIFTGAGPAIVTVKVLNFCVRDGNRCVHFAIATRSLEVIPSKPNNSSIFLMLFFLWLSPRPISISQLHASLHFHLWPIYLVVFKGSYYLRMGNLILESVSCLDAFSAYPFPS